jgi:hypothetical protein
MPQEALKPLQTYFTITQELKASKAILERWRVFLSFFGNLAESSPATRQKKRYRGVTG